MQGYEEHFVSCKRTSCKNTKVYTVTFTTYIVEKCHQSGANIQKPHILDPYRIKYFLNQEGSIFDISDYKNSIL